jgi:hypothetical protein
MVTGGQNDSIAAVASTPQTSIEVVQPFVTVEDHVQSIEGGNLRDSVEVYNDNDESSVVDQFRDSSLYQDRGSDLTLEETDQHDLDGMNTSQRNSHQRNSQFESQDDFEVAANVQDEIELNAAFEYIREICSPTVSYSLQSDQWAHRKEGMELIQKYIERNVGPVKKMTEEQCNVEFKWLCILIRKYFLDRVAPVFYSAYDCFRALLKVYSNYIHGSEIENLLGSMVQPLLSNLGGESTGTNKRTQKEACRCILRIARLTAIDGLGLILNMLSASSSTASGSGCTTISTPTTGFSSSPSPFAPSSTSSSSAAIGIKQKLILLKILINEFSITEPCGSSNGNGNGNGNNYDTGISTDLVLSICQVGMNHSDDKIRKSAVDLLCVAYQKVGKNLKMYLTDIKPAMLKVLEKKFNDIDSSGNSNSSSSSFSSTAPAALMGSSNSNGDTSSSATEGRSKTKKTENIRNLAPVVLKHTASSGTGGSFGGSRNKLLSAHLNSSFSGTAMLSKNADGEENFVVMKSPNGNKKNQSQQLSASGSVPSSATSSSSLRREHPATRGTSSSDSSAGNDKENTDSRGGVAGAAAGAGGGGVVLAPVTNKNRFEFSGEDLLGASSSSPSSVKKDKSKGSSTSSSNNSKGNPVRPQQQQQQGAPLAPPVAVKQKSSMEDNRFYIDESLL